jgi:stage V sporulation protein R
VAGKRLDEQRKVWQYYVKSRKAQDYREMMLQSLYHPPVITVDPARGKEGSLYLVHAFEGKQLVQEFIANTMMGVEFLWGAPVHLETSEAQFYSDQLSRKTEGKPESEIRWQRVVYTMKEKVLTKEIL